MCPFTGKGFSTLSTFTAVRDKAYHSHLAINITELRDRETLRQALACEGIRATAVISASLEPARPNLGSGCRLDLPQVFPMMTPQGASCGAAWRWTHFPVGDTIPLIGKEQCAGGDVMMSWVNVEKPGKVQKKQ